MKNTLRTWQYWMYIVLMTGLLSACGNDIKQDIIALDEAVTATGMNGSDIKQAGLNIENATTPEELTEAITEVSERMTVYNKAINQLNFQSNEVRQIRDDLSRQNHQIITALNDVVQLNLRSDMHNIDSESHQKIQNVIERSQHKIATSEEKTVLILRKLQALGADNGVQIILQ